MVIVLRPSLSVWGHKYCQNIEQQPVWGLTDIFFLHILSTLYKLTLIWKELFFHLERRNSSNLQTKILIIHECEFCIRFVIQFPNYYNTVFLPSELIRKMVWIHSSMKQKNGRTTRKKRKKWPITTSLSAYPEGEENRGGLRGGWQEMTQVFGWTLRKPGSLKMMWI